MRQIWHKAHEYLGETAPITAHTRRFSVYCSSQEYRDTQRAHFESSTEGTGIHRQPIQGKEDIGNGTGRMQHRVTRRRSILPPKAGRARCRHLDIRPEAILSGLQGLSALAMRLYSQGPDPLHPADTLHPGLDGARTCMTRKPNALVEASARRLNSATRVQRLHRQTHYKTARQ
ncbi:hypothetical protein PYCCODRAFT_1041319 [Trametes coccinea BRFM310]|uniref:Uncharacterized protein n=1 Tax=Trametes coccinea (strain BRFM310) TaxID=1353009 RepID=A0A1Y2IA92_TRAC3|nr:hypothetical protein PYCCODRAFT_1041319 [Trametes coccinea BRFM310]